MSEMKCPLCGVLLRENLNKEVECFRCPFRCALSDLPRIAAAMELAKALNEMDKLDAEMRSTGCVSDELRYKRISAHRRICNAMDKRAEVFK